MGIVEPTDRAEHATTSTGRASRLSQHERVWRVQTAWPAVVVKDQDGDDVEIQLEGSAETIRVSRGSVLRHDPLPHNERVVQPDLLLDGDVVYSISGTRGTVLGYLPDGRVDVQFDRLPDSVPVKRERLTTLRPRIVG